MADEFKELGRLLELKWLSTLARLRPLQQREEELRQQLDKIDRELASSNKLLEEAAGHCQKPATAWLFDLAQVFQRAQQFACSRILSARHSVEQLAQQATELERPLYLELARERARQATAGTIARREKARAARKLRSVSQMSLLTKGGSK
jgi:hypothetical protein